MPMWATRPLRHRGQRGVYWGNVGGAGAACPCCLGAVSLGTHDWILLSQDDFPSSLGI